MYIPTDLGPEASDLRRTVRSFLKQRDTVDPRELVRRDVPYDVQLWAAMSEDLGLPGLSIPEKHGGAGMGSAEMAAVQREIGRAMVAVPFLSSVALGAQVLLGMEDDALAATWLPRIASGSLLVAVGTSDEDGVPGVLPDSAAALDGDGVWRLTGVRGFVVDGAFADVVLVPVQAGHGLTIFAVDAGAVGVTRLPRTTLDLSRPQCDILLDQAVGRPVGPIGGATAAWSQALHTAALALVAEQVGGAELLVETAVEFAKTRVQFGRPIGSFQAIKHKLADMALDLEKMESAVQLVVASLAGTEDDADVAVHLARVFCAEAYFRIAADCIHIHGGIGFTWEHPTHLHFRRAKSAGSLMGSTAFHRESMLTALGV
jgi:alkylation response protein AidB-like acyl-CoA dehydrogenase